MRQKGDPIREDSMDAAELRAWEQLLRKGVPVTAPDYAERLRRLAAQYRAEGVKE